MKENNKKMIDKSRKNYKRKIKEEKAREEKRMLKDYLSKKE